MTIEEAYAEPVRHTEAPGSRVHDWYSGSASTAGVIATILLNRAAEDGSDARRRTRRPSCSPRLSPERPADGAHRRARGDGMTRPRPIIAAVSRSSTSPSA